MKKLLIVANKKSILTNKLQNLVGDYFDNAKILDNSTFSLFSPIKLFKSIKSARKIILSYKPSFIILYQIEVASFFITIINKKFNIPTLVVGIGSDILTVPGKSIFHKFIATYVIRHNIYFNAGSIAIKEKMITFAKKPINIVLANLGTDDILPLKKQNIIFSNRLHKPIYNIDKIIQAFAVFVNNPQRKDWRLVIAAEGNEKELKTQVKKLNIEKNVDFVSWLDKQKNAYYYGISKIWISLPKSDSISISLLEAMSAECIPIVYNVPAIKGFLNNNNAVIINSFEGNFIEKALHMDNLVLATNRRLAREFSDKNINKQKFYGIFDKALNE